MGKVMKLLEQVNVPDSDHIRIIKLESENNRLKSLCKALTKRKIVLSNQVNDLHRIHKDDIRQKELEFKQILSLKMSDVESRYKTLYINKVNDIRTKLRSKVKCTVNKKLKSKLADKENAFNKRIKKITRIISLTKVKSNDKLKQLKYVHKNEKLLLKKQYSNVEKLLMSIWNKSEHTKQEIEQYNAIFGITDTTSTDVMVDNNTQI